MKEDEFFSFRKQSPRMHYQRTIPELLKPQPHNLVEGWYFVGHLLHSPQTIIVDGEIRQIIKICELGNLQQTIIVILTEIIVRKYCNMLKPGQNYRFKNGEVKTEFFRQNYVIMNENSEIANLYFCEESEDGSMMEEHQKIREGGSVKKKEALETKSKKMGEFNFTLSNVVVKKSQRLDNGVSAMIGNNNQNQDESNPRRTKSQKIENGKKVEKGSGEEFKCIVGRVLCSYIVGHEKAHHGKGYKIEQICEKREKRVFEVVIWSDFTPTSPLLIGRIYEFKDFRVNHKPNYRVSFYSHFLNSTIRELE